MKDLLKPKIPGGVVGNSRMLASILGNGELYRLFWPYIDQGQHIGRFWVGLRDTGEHQVQTLWLHDPHGPASQHYLPDTNILLTDLDIEHRGVKVRQTDFVLPREDILVRHYSITSTTNQPRNLTMVLYCSLNIDESELYDTMYINFEHQALIQFRRDVYLGLRAPGYPLAGYQCGRKDTSSDPRQAVEHGEFWGTDSNLRHGAGALGWHLDTLNPGETKDITILLGAASDEAQLLSSLNDAAGTPPATLLENTARHWQGWLGLPDTGREAGDDTMYNRSLLAMKLMSDRQTGASIAAPEFDPYYIKCGGYGYCWPRDGMYVAIALDEAGHHQEARDFYGFAARVQNADGSWQQRYFMDGSQAPTWGKQTDQAGAVLFGYWHHFKLTNNTDFLNEIWPSVQLGAAFLISDLLPDNSLPRPGYDQWEDFYAQASYTCAAVYGGLWGASRLAAARGEGGLAQDWSEAAARVKSGILEHLWEPSLQRFLRGVHKRCAPWDHNQACEMGQHAWTDKDPLGIYTTYWVARDDRLDSALLALVYPFGVITPHDPMAVSTVEAIERELTNQRVGGIHRYSGDNYAGGNPWVLLTLWLSIYHSLAGNKEKALPLIQWVLDNANHAGLLPEQVNKDCGGPAWVVPLNWSHAMYVLARLAADGKLRGLGD